MLPEAIWLRRHRAIVWFALGQAVLLGVFGLTRGQTVATCAIDVAVVGLPALLGMNAGLSRRIRTNSATVSLMFASAMLVDLSGGVTEAHFHFFVMLGVVALYQGWVAFGVCVLITVAHHAIMGTLVPRAVYGGSDEWQHPVRWAFIHGGFVLAASVTHLIAWKANEQQELSDPLTRLPNRTAFVEALDRRLAVPGGVVSVLFVDLDNFKTINDSSGHHVGDLALQHAAQRMLKVMREGDMVARLGGDEFAVLVNGDAEHAAAVGRRISGQLQAPVAADGREIFINASIGVADSLLAGSRASADLLRDADLAMYLAKSSGKNQVVTYTAGVDRVVSERAELAVDIRAALADGQFEIHYQPLMRGGELSGVEALIRWNHPVRGELPPAEFIPLAEETGEISAIGAWVLTNAVTEVARWRSQIPGCVNLSLAVNLSPVQLRDPGLPEFIAISLNAAGLPAANLTLEVTEGVLLQDLDLARRQLDAVRDLGVVVAIDDFGTGYSSLSYLAKLPADQVKIDKSFVANLTHGSGSVAVVKAIVDMARALNLDIVAEGVELDAQLDILAQFGSLTTQGYLYAEPLSVYAFEQFAARGDHLPAMPADPSPGHRPPV